MDRPIPAISGLYAITPDCVDTAKLLRLAESALSGGVTILQYRSKIPDELLRLRQAELLRDLTRRFSVPLIINDDVRLAKQIDADGVHLGITDIGLTGARAFLGKQRMIGISCYNNLSRAREAFDLGADYLAFGSFYSSRSKPDAVVAGIELLRSARAEFPVPLVAIGGICARNAMPLIEAGADALAVISALFGATNVKSASAEFVKLFNQSMT
jgi:thiamine-phosphate pyrophosphorylase